MYPASAGSSRQTGAPSVERRHCRPAILLAGWETTSRWREQPGQTGFRLDRRCGIECRGSRSEAVLSRGNRAPESTRVAALRFCVVAEPARRAPLLDRLDPPLSRSINSEGSGLARLGVGFTWRRRRRLVRAGPPLVGLQVRSCPPGPLHACVITDQLDLVAFGVDYDMESQIPWSHSSNRIDSASRSRLACS